MKTLGAFIREHKELILATWLDAAVQLPSAHNLARPAIRDHVPELLDSLAEAIDRDDHSAVPMRGLPSRHAAVRLREGYDLRQVIWEYRALRRVILDLYAHAGDISEDSRPKLAPLRDMSAALDAAIGDAVDQFALDRDKSREMFIGMLGHDLRDPLNTIVFSAQNLLDDEEHLDARALRAAARIRSNGARMEAMIRDLLDFARGRLGPGLPVVPVPLDARPLIDAAVEDIAHAHPERDLASLATTAAGDFRVEWDGDRIAQAISNLVGNAIAHGSDPIVVEPIDCGETIAIEVRNRGAIAPSVLSRLFEPFSEPSTDRRLPEAADRRGDVRPDSVSDRRRGHLGLGLYIVREISVAHGGQVMAESKEGTTTFRITLPRRASPTRNVVSSN